MMTANVRHRSVASSLKIRPSHRQRIRPIGVDSTTHSVAKDKRRLMRKHNHHWLSYFSTKREFYQWTAQTKKIVVEMDLKMTKRLLQVESILLMISHPVSHPFLSRVIKYICIYMFIQRNSSISFARVVFELSCLFFTVFNLQVIGFVLV